MPSVSAPSSNPAPVDGPPPAPPRAEPGAAYHPPPFSADRIRAATGEGQTYRFRTTTEDDVYEREVRFEEVGPDGATLVIRRFDAEGAARSGAERRRVRWTELEGHGAAPVGGTTISEVEVEVPAGRFDAWLYETVLDTPEGPARIRSWFAVDLPGAPVRHELHQDGLLRSTTVLLRFEPGAAPAQRSSSS